MKTPRPPDGGVAWTFRRIAPRGSRRAPAFHRASGSFDARNRPGGPDRLGIHHGDPPRGPAAGGGGRGHRRGLAGARACRAVRRRAGDSPSLHRLSAPCSTFAEVDLVVLGLPNDLHCEATCLAAQARKHVVVEKPMAPSLAECDRMIAACERAGVMLGYAEELCFTPKYVRLKRTGRRRCPGQGPPGQAVREARRPARRLVLRHPAQRRGRDLRHGLPRDRVLPMDPRRPGDRGQGADRRASTPRWAPTSTATRPTATTRPSCSSTFEGGAVGLAEESWTKPGGMDDRAEVFGSEGQAYADVLHGNALRAYSRRGYGYAVEKAGSTAGWSFPIYEEIWNYGFPQEMEHFVACVRDGDPAREDGRDGRAVVEAIHALYASAGSGLPRRAAVRQRCRPARSITGSRPVHPSRRLTASMSSPRSPSGGTHARRRPRPPCTAPCPRRRARRSPAEAGGPPRSTWSRAPSIWK